MARFSIVAIIALAISACAPQTSLTSDMSASDRAMLLGTWMQTRQPITAYQQPFYPMQPIPVAQPCCGYY